ncbi:MAG: prenyltransferase [Thaumarchaeota archaeon]|nr:prenyltransferase [Nitrososphaerota archaeon]
MSRVGTWYKILNGTYDVHSTPVGELDVLSRWLIATRSVVFVMTVNSVIIGGLLYLISAGFSWSFLLPFALALVGLVTAHAASNLFNDYWDAKHGIDTSQDYFRPAYMPHPTLSGMMSPRGLFSLGLGHLFLMLAITAYFVAVRGPPVLVLAGLGVVFLTSYAGGPLPLKRIGLGEPTVFVVWGPLMVGGTFFVLSGMLPLWVIVASVPYAVSVTTVLFGKHIDKIDYDTPLGVKTLPVLLGEAATKKALEALIVIAYVAVVGLVAARYLPIWSLISLLALPRASQLFRILSKPRPKERPADALMWPIWYLGFVFSHNRRFGALYVFGLVLGVLLPVYV